MFATCAAETHLFRWLFSLRTYREHFLPCAAEIRESWAAFLSTFHLSTQSPPRVAIGFVLTSNFFLRSSTLFFHLELGASSQRNSGIDDYNSLRLGNVENYKEWSSTMSRKTTFGWLSPIIPNHNNHSLSLLCRRFVCCEPVRSNNQYVVVARYVLYTIRMNNRESFIVTHFFLLSPLRHT